MTNQVNKSIIVKGKISDIFAIWENFENFPNFMKPVKSVKKTGDRSSHWVLEGPDGENLEWDAETTTLEKNKRIAWNSKDGGDIKTTGQVTFTELPHEETQVTVTLQYVPENGLAAKATEKLIADPEQQLLENLRSFKSFAEARYKERN